MNTTNVKATLRAIVFAALIAAAGACEHSTSIGAVGHPDAGLDLGDDASTADADAMPSTAAELCTSTGGAVATNSCCGQVSPFPDTCTVGACSCAPASSRSTPFCQCAAGCFLPDIGCVGPPDVCTAGMDLSCNQDTTQTSPRGRCVTENRCVCSPGAALSSAGKCQ